MSTDDLDASLRLILESLPDEEDMPNKRRMALTKSDFIMFADMIKVAMKNQGCSIGLDSHQIAALKNTRAETFEAMGAMVKERRRILAVIGTGFVTLMAWVGSKIFDALDWHKIGGLFKGH